MDANVLLIIGMVVLVGVEVVRRQRKQGVVKRESAVHKSEPPDWIKGMSPTSPSNDWGDGIGLSQEQVAQINTELGAGRKIVAIKLYREFTGEGLKEAKEAVEAIGRGQRPALSGYQSPVTNQPLGGVMAQIEQELRAKRKINAIKLYREAHNVGLKEAKDAVDEMERNLRR